MIAVLVLVVYALPAVGQTIGIRNIEVRASDGQPGFVARTWYPATGGLTETFGASRIRPGYEAVPDAVAVLSDDAPLVILVHGSGGSADSMAWLALGLAERLGALVVAADHPGSSGGNPERASILEVWQQPADVSRLIDHVFASDRATNIDPDRVYVVGFSLGGAAALSVAGARLAFERFPAFCEQYDDGACRAFRQHFDRMDDAFFQRANADLREPRIRRAVAVAPGFTESLIANSVASMSTPFMIIAGADDQQLPPATHLAPIRDHIPAHSRLVEISEAQHFSFLPACRDDAASVLAETNEEFVCEEVGTKTRGDIHEEVLQLIASFLE